MSQTETNLAEPSFGPTEGNDSGQTISSAAPSGKTESASEPATDSGQAVAGDADRAPEEESQSEIPGDPRPPHQTQPPTKEEY